MAYRTTPFVNGEYYHLFNRGVAKMNVFTNAHDFQRFIRTFQYYLIDGPKPKFSIYTPTIQILDKSRRIISVATYCLMPNHFHLLVKQEREGGISEFISKVLNSYTKYFNTKYKRVGPLFQGQFKAVHIERNEQLIHVNRYIHLNPLVAYLIKNLEAYKWSSYTEYVNNGEGLCEKEIILSQFPSIQKYRDFINDQIDYGKTLEAIKHKLIDPEE